MFSTRHLPLLTFILAVALATPGLAAAEVPLPEAPDTAAAASATVEAAPVEAASTPPAEATSETTPAPAAPDDAAVPPPPPTPEPQTTTSASPTAAGPSSDSATSGSTNTPSPRQIVEDTTAAVSSAAGSALPSEPQQLTGAAQEKVAEIASDAAGKGEVILDAATKTVDDTTSQPVDLARPARDVVSTVLGSAADAMLPVGEIGAILSGPAAGNPVSAENRPRLSPPASETAKLHFPLVPAATFFFPAPAEPVIEIPATSTVGDEAGRSSLSDPRTAPYALPAPFVPPRAAAENVNSMGNPSPAVPLPSSPTLPDALDAITMASGGAGSALLLALLALPLLLAPTFASKLRMHAGNCRPAPFVSLLERPG